MILLFGCSGKPCTMNHIMDDTREVAPIGMETTHSRRRHYSI